MIIFGARRKFWGVVRVKRTGYLFKPNSTWRSDITRQFLRSRSNLLKVSEYFHATINFTDDSRLILGCIKKHPSQTYRNRRKRNLFVLVYKIITISVGGASEYDAQWSDWVTGSVCSNVRKERMSLSFTYQTRMDYPLPQTNTEQSRVNVTSDRNRLEINELNHQEEKCRTFLLILCQDERED